MAHEELPAAPAENVKIYSDLFVLETTLRELLVDELTKRFGPMWYNERLPPDALTEFRSGIQADRLVRWAARERYHPVYYLTLPDLRKTIERRDNWSDVFKTIFPADKELISTDLHELEFIRNKVAHNRRASHDDEEMVHVVLTKLSQILGDRMSTLAQRCSVAPEMAPLIKALQREAAVAYVLASKDRFIKKLPIWQEARHSWWWFDPAYLGAPVADILRFFHEVDEYRSGERASDGSSALAELHAASGANFKSLERALARM